MPVESRRRGREEGGTVAQTRTGEQPRAGVNLTLGFTYAVASIHPRGG